MNFFQELQHALEYILVARDLRTNNTKWFLEGMNLQLLKF